MSKDSVKHKPIFLDVQQLVRILSPWWTKHFWAQKGRGPLKQTSSQDKEKPQRPRDHGKEEV